MKYLKLFENFEDKLTIDYLQDNFPIKLDTEYQKYFGKKRYYININGKNHFYFIDDGLNRVKLLLLNCLQSKITDIELDTQLIKQHLKSV